PHQSDTPGLGAVPAPRFNLQTRPPYVGWVRVDRTQQTLDRLAARLGGQGVVVAGSEERRLLDIVPRSRPEHQCYVVGVGHEPSSGHESLWRTSAASPAPRVAE